MKVKDLLSRLSKANPEAEILMVDTNFSSFMIEDTESFFIDDDEVTIYIGYE